MNEAGVELYNTRGMLRAVSQQVRTVLLLCAMFAPAGDAQTLRDAGASRALRIGAAVQARLLSEPQYVATLAREFSQVEPENEMKFGPLHPAPATYNFTNADAIVSFASARGLAVRGHTLVWHNPPSLPSWLTSGSFSPSQLSQILQDHITTVVRHFARGVYAWDVVNEAFDEAGRLRPTIWYNNPGIGLSGTGFIEQAFRWARAADANALLFYNDFNTEAVNAKSDAIYNMVRDFRNRGVPIDGIGLQMHISPRAIPDMQSVAANLRRLSDLGIQVQITELDVPLPVDNAGTASAADLAAQARIYREMALLCVQNPRCTAIQTWGFTDRYSSIPAAFPGMGAGLPFDAGYQPKAAYSALQEVLASTPPAISAAGLVNAASYAGGAIASGELVTLFGARFGPADAATLRLDANGRVANTLSDARLLFDGTPAPMVFASPAQVSAFVPYSLAGRSAVQLQYEYRGVRSNVASIAVADASPGLFTLDASGRGPAPYSIRTSA